MLERVSITGRGLLPEIIFFHLGDLSAWQGNICLSVFLLAFFELLFLALKPQNTNLVPNLKNLEE